MLLIYYIIVIDHLNFLTFNLIVYNMRTFKSSTLFIVHYAVNFLRRHFFYTMLIDPQILFVIRYIIYSSVDLFLNIVTAFMVPTSVAGVVVSLATVDDVDDTMDVSDEYCHDSPDDRRGGRSWNSVKSGDRRSCRTTEANPPPVTAGRLATWCVPDDSGGCCPVTDAPSSDRCNVIKKSATAMVLAQCASTGSGLDSRLCRVCSGADDPYTCGSCNTCGLCDPRW